MQPKCISSCLLFWHVCITLFPRMTIQVSGKDTQIINTTHSTILPPLLRNIMELTYATQAILQ